MECLLDALGEDSACLVIERIQGRVVGCQFSVARAGGGWRLFTGLISWAKVLCTRDDTGVHGVAGI
jgi:hypothetical protein